jgi:hypothetical protein
MYLIILNVYTKGTYVRVEVITELRELQRGTPAIEAKRERRRIYNKNERVSKEAQAVQARENPKV